ncbi:hypothetical protein PR048_021302 [Dryococelus australis]|uniref:Uncharacterized protein n=1 Tax=Dryococelus australis TaxID=614101 RepID=A0ABQ9GXT4_9NEOP|nr:hypothetical protein PR048_021302 [Dryococelus australis]
MQRHEAVKWRSRLDYPSKKQTKRRNVLAPPVEDYEPNVLEPEDTEALQQKLQFFAALLQVTRKTGQNCSANDYVKRI